MEGLLSEDGVGGYRRIQGLEKSGEYIYVPYEASMMDKCLRTRMLERKDKFSGA